MNLGNRVAKVIKSGTEISESRLQNNQIAFAQALQNPVGGVTVNMYHEEELHAA